jgi:hypothetical protein
MDRVRQDSNSVLILDAYRTSCRGSFPPHKMLTRALLVLHVEHSHESAPNFKFRHQKRSVNKTAKRVSSSCARLISSHLTLSLLLLCCCVSLSPLLLCLLFFYVILLFLHLSLILICQFISFSRCTRPWSGIEETKSQFFHEINYHLSTKIK